MTTPPKRCTFDCVYCQLGRTIVHATEPEEPNTVVSPDRVLDDLDKALMQIDLNSVDVVTFSGTGEPTLNRHLEEIARGVKERIGDLPMVILTNASLFQRSDTRKALTQFDMVVAKLDAGDEEAFQSINRPKSNTLNVQTVISSIKRVREEVGNKLALEVMLLETGREGTTNVEGKHLRNLLDTVGDIRPDLVQLLVPYRPPAEDFVRIPSTQRLKFVSEKLAEALGEEKLWVYGRHDRRGKTVKRIGTGSQGQEILEILKRRPCRATDISSSLGISHPEASQLLKNLEQEGRIVLDKIRGEGYYTQKENRNRPQTRT